MLFIHAVGKKFLDLKIPSQLAILKSADEPIGTDDSSGDSLILFVSPLNIKDPGEGTVLVLRLLWF